MSALERVEGPSLRRQLDTLKEQIAPQATDAELDYFGAVCQRLDLDPFAGQIVLIGRFDKRAGRAVHRHQVTVAGRRAVAARTGRLRGIDGPVWCGPRQYADDGSKLPLEWSEVWDEDDEPYAARCLVYVDGWEVPANGTVKWSEFAQEEGTGDAKRVSTNWVRMPSHMLGKVAESLALRRAFPEVEHAVAGGWGGDDDTVVLDEASADFSTRNQFGSEPGTTSTPEVASPEIPVPAGTVQARTSTAGAEQRAAAPGSRRPVERRPRRDEVPVELYDNLPEAQG